MTHSSTRSHRRAPASKAVKPTHQLAEDGRLDCCISLEVTQSSVEKETF